MKEDIKDKDFPYCPHCDRITDPGCLERCDFFKELIEKEEECSK